MSASLLNELAVRITEDRETLTARLKMMIGFVDRIDSLFAGVALLNSNEATTVMGKDDLRTRIRNERRAELPIEGVTFFDELRWKTWKDNVCYRGNGRKQIWGGNVAAYSFKADDIYTWPIPLGDIVMNPALDQNLGWIN